MTKRSGPAFAMTVLLAASFLPCILPAPARAQATELWCLDQDAHGVSGEIAGALFRIDLTAPPTAAPFVEAAADRDAPDFQFVSGLAISPLDGRAYVTDLGLAFGSTADGRLHAVTLGGAGPVDLLTITPPLQDPWDLTFLPDGRLVVVDWEADPSGLGVDRVGGEGHGALFAIDVASGVSTLLADGTNHSLPGFPPGSSVFEDPLGVVWDEVSGLLYVADFSADADDDGYFGGSLFAVDPVTAEVTLVSAYWNFAALVAVTVRPDGRPLLIDALPDDSVLFEIDFTEPDLTENALFLSSGTQYALLEGVGVSNADEVFVADIGDWDSDAGSWRFRPGVYRVDESRRGIDPDFDLDNAIAVSTSMELISPIALALSAGLPGDRDGDTVLDGEDNCPNRFNTNQADGDADNVGDLCDNCPETVNTGQEDRDADRIGDDCDVCPDVPDPFQRDLDRDGLGDVCDDDIDGDGAPNDLDCAPADPGDPEPVPELMDLRVSRVPSGGAELSWSTPPTGLDDGFQAVNSGLLSELAADRGFASACALGSVLPSVFLDGRTGPGVGEGFWYLVQGLNDCGPGAVGTSLPASRDVRSGLDWSALAPCP